ncbi:MAG: Heat shock HtpX-like protein [Herminiimonas sp.]|nr:Heat shock HtpX-like protein [Herminiimonas sp.]
MNFFEQQHQARRQTRTLVILFALAVIAIVVAVNIVAAVLWIWAQGGRLSGAHFYPKGFFATNTVITLGLIVGGTLIEMFNLRDGGDAVAQMAGGRMVSPASQDLQEKRLLNVVAEMALASGIACPKVYVLDRERAINAFAAGYTANEAVVAVTRGAISRLTRDELQGVVAHEFSHILNGDMRLNVRLIGVLFGIQMIASFGQHLMNFGTRFSGPRSRDDKGPSLQLIMLALGIALFLIGYIGVFFGRLIKSAVSRQREFLADASSVQFTRNPGGIGGALRKIGGLSREMKPGSRIDHPNAEQLSHLFLGASRPSLISGMFATHPPIAVRLRRIYGKSVELLDAPEMAEAGATAAMLPDIPFIASGFTEGAPVSAATAPSIEFGRSIVEKIRLAPELDGAVRDPQAACAVVYALLLERGAGRDRQIQQIQQLIGDTQQAALAAYLAESIDRLPKNARLPLLDLTMPALKQLSDADRAKLLAAVERLIAADNKITLTEFVLQTILTRRLDARAGRATPVRFAGPAALKQECATLLSLVAHIAVSTANQAPDETPLDAFMRGAARCPELGLSPSDLSAVSMIRFAQVRTALDRVNQLAPLAKPALIKSLLAAAGEADILPLATADLLRAICAALEAPMPPAVAATYTDCALSDE